MLCRYYGCLLSITLSVTACQSDREETMGVNGTGGMPATAAVGGTTATSSGGSGASGGSIATMTAKAGASAGGQGGAVTAGVGGMAGSAGAGGITAIAGSGGMAGRAGSSEAAAGSTANGSENVGGASGERAPTGTPGGPCKPIGWATRNGRTGGAVEVTGGGDATPIVVKSFAELQSNAEGDQPRVIHIDSTAGMVGSGWSGTSGDRLEVGSNKTIVGLHPDTQLRAPIHVGDASNVVIRNLVIRGPGSNDDQAWDNLNIDGSSKNIWIDHCEFWDGQDGNADVVKGADNVTFTWNIFGYTTDGDHNFSNLVASSDDEPQSEGKLDITLMFNWFTGVAQRQPRCRYGDIHVVNNLFTRDGHKSDYGISAGKNCRVLTEANHFIEINTPISMSHASGSAANELRGDNLFESTTGSTQGYGTAFEPPYDYKQQLVAASEVKALVESKAGAKLENPGQCDW